MDSDVMNTSGVTSDEDLVDNSTVHRNPDLSASKSEAAIRHMILILIPVLVVLGTLGNILNILVMRRSAFSKLSIGVYFLALACSDTIFLFTNTLSSDWLEYVTGVDIQSKSTWSCKMLKYVLMSSRCLSAWLIVVVSIERLVAINTPYVAKVWATPRRSRLVLLGLFVTIACAYVHMLVLMEVNEEALCYWRKEDINRNVPFIANIYDMVLYSLVPSAILISTSAMLIYKLVKRGEFHNEAVRVRHSGKAERSAETTHMTFTLVTVSVTFLLLTLPMTLDQTFYMAKIFSPDLAYYAFYLLNVVNHSVNFLLYTLSGRTFRRELNIMFCTRRARNGESRIINSRNTNTSRISKQNHQK